MAGEKLPPQFASPQPPVRGDLQAAIPRPVGVPPAHAPSWGQPTRPAAGAAPAPVAPSFPPAPAPGRPGVPLNPFLSQGPRQKARRLARALVSDIAVYHADRRREALRAGRLKEAFAEEIKKSWEEYTVQVGRDLAESTPFFTEALNEILAEGQPVF